MAIKKGNIDKIEIEVNTMFYLEAPVMEKDILGNVKILLNNEVIEVLEIYNKETINKKDVLDYMYEFIYIITTMGIV